MDAIKAAYAALGNGPGSEMRKRDMLADLKRTTGKMQRIGPATSRRIFEFVCGEDPNAV